MTGRSRVKRESPQRARVRPEPPDVRPGAAAAVFLAMSIVYFFPAFLPGRHIFGTDYLAGGYFFYDFVSDRLAAGELPKWVPYIFGGLPLFANPGSAYQPIHLLLSIVLPTSKLLAGVFVVHFWLAGFGTYLLARELRCRGWVALVAGLSYQFTGLVLSWVYAGHDGRIIVATLAPLYLFFLRRGIRTAGPGPFVGAAATLALALLSFQIQNAYYLLVGAAIWALYSIVHLGAGRSGAGLSRVVGLGLGSVAFAFLIASINFLPFVDYIDQSPRGVEGGRGYEYSTSFSMPPGELLSAAVPEAHGVSVSDPVTGEPLFPQYTGQNGFKLHTEYLGAFAILLLVLGGVYTRRDRDWWFFLGLAAFMLTIALGGHTPLYRLYYELLPGTRQFRAPSLAFFMVALSLVTMAALTLERLAKVRDDALTPQRRSEKTEGPTLDRVPLAVGGVAVVALLGALTGGEAAAGWVRFLLFVIVIGGALAAWSRDRLGTLALALLLSVATVADLWIVGKRFLHTVDPPELIFGPDDVTAFLGAQPEPARIWTFPLVQQYRGGGSYGGDFPMLYGIEQVGGEHPNPLRSWVEYVGAGTETYIDWQNLIIDPQVVGTAEGQAVAFGSRSGFLDAANVRYIVSMAPIADPGLREVHRGSALIYENLGALPRAYLVPEVEVVPEEGALERMVAGPWDPAEVAYVSGASAVDLPGGPLEGDATVVQHTPDRVVVRTRASRPALLVLADNYYDGWEATVDGRPEEVLRANHTFRGVVVDAGEREVVFEFRPSDLYLGLYVYLAGILLLLGYAVWAFARRRGRAPVEAAE